MSAWLGWLLCLALAQDPSFTEGQALYRAFEYEQAIFRFQEVAVRPGLTSAERASALVWLGLSYAGTGDLEAASRNFRDALRIDATVTLPPSVSPRVAQLFDEARATVGAAATPTPTAPATPPAQPGDPPEDARAPDATTSSPAPLATEGAESDGGSSLFVPGVAAVAVGGAALVAGLVLAGLASASYAEATDPEAFQDDAQAALGRANAEVIAAAVVLPLGAIAAGAGITMVTLSLLDE